MPIKENSLQNVLDHVVDQKRVFGTSFAIKNDHCVWTGASGNLTINQPYFIASTTKLFTTAIILRLIMEEKIRLNDNISRFLDDSVLKGLHIFNGADYSHQITVQNLLAHTSGLPDYFQDKGQGGKSLEKELMNGLDQYWTFEQVVDRTKAMKPYFVPGVKGKAHYSDTNFQLLGKIIENITTKTFSEICSAFIIKPLELSHTYMYNDAADSTPKKLYYKAKELNIPNAMTSFGADGGIVSNSTDMLTFLESFFKGKLFPAEYINQLQVWNRIFYPIKSGIGIHLFKLPWFFDPKGAIPYFIGHSGLSGALAYYSPKKNIYITGTVNQVAYPDISFKIMIKLAIHSLGS